MNGNSLTESPLILSRGGRDYCFSFVKTITGSLWCGSQRFSSGQTVAPGSWLPLCKIRHDKGVGRSSASGLKATAQICSIPSSRNRFLSRGPSNE